MDLLAASLAETFDLLWYIAMFIMGLGAVVFFHELGHFMVAKWVGIRVEVFSIGMGPRILGYRGKETDYRISLVPLGGYIKMTGQEDFAALKEGEVDDRSFSNKSVGARFAVIAAGVIMNVLFAAVAYVVIGMIGIQYHTTTLGAVDPYGTAAKTTVVWEDGGEDTVGFKPGDTIVSIDGKAIEAWRQIQMKSALADRDQVFEFVISRPTDDGGRIGRASAGVSFSESVQQGVSLAFGLSPSMDLVLAENRKHRVDTGGVAPGDRVIAVDGSPVEYRWQLPDLTTDQPVPVQLRRADSEETYSVDMTPALYTSGKVHFLKDGTMLRAVGAERNYDDRKDPSIIFTLADEEGTKVTVKLADLASTVLDVVGLQPRIAITAISKGSPADDAELQPGDIVADYARQGPPTLPQFLTRSAEFVSDGTQISVLRDGQLISHIDIDPKKHNGMIAVGTVIGIDQEHLVIADVREGSPAAKAEIHSEDVITHVNDVPVTTWPDMIDALAATQATGQPAVLTVARGVQTLTITLGDLTGEQFNRDDYDLALFTGIQWAEVLRGPLIKHSNPLTAVAWGWRQTLEKLHLGYMQFPALFKGNVSSKGVSGPIGIGSMAVGAAREGLIEFIDFMAFISVLLAVINFMPIPVVDGGHAMFLIIEKVRGKPLSVRVMNMVQLVGLVLLLGLFLVITGRDIWRLIENMW